MGQRSKEAITTAREQIAEVIGAKPEEIYFTAGGSEADNWALKAACEAYEKKGKHIITTKIEDVYKRQRYGWISVCIFFQSIC